MSSKDPAFLFYYQDFLVGTAFMSNQEKGAYITVLCHIADKDEITRSNIIKICEGNEELAENIISKLKANSNGMYYNNRLLEEKEKRARYTPYKIASATLGGLISSSNLTKKQIKFVKNRFDINEFKNLKSKEEIRKEVSKWLSICLTIYENENENENENKVKDEIEDKKDNIDKRRLSFKNSIKEMIGDNIAAKEIAREFFNYWAQEMQNKGVPIDLMRWEAEKTWNLKMRYSTWLRNKTKFDVKKEEEKAERFGRRGESTIGDILKIKE